MRSLRQVALFLLFIFVGGALIAPWVFWCAQTGAATWPALDPLARLPFHRFVNRSFMLLALIGLWPFLRGLGIRSWSEAGLGGGDRALGRCASGLAVGFVSLACVAGVALAGAGRALDLERTGPQVARHLANAGGAALVVSVIEELFFRGALFGALRRAWPWSRALLVSSAVYALVHFFERTTSPDPVGWSTGLVVLARMLRGFADWQALIPGFLNLTLAGIILGLAYQRSGSLYFSIGLHAGWIFWLKTYGFLTTALPEAATGFWGTGKLIDGWLAFLVLLPVAWFITRLFPGDGVRARLNEGRG